MGTLESFELKIFFKEAASKRSDESQKLSTNLKKLKYSSGIAKSILGTFEGFGQNKFF